MNRLIKIVFWHDRKKIKKILESLELHLYDRELRIEDAGMFARKLFDAGLNVQLIHGSEDVDVIIGISGSTFSQRG